MDDLFDELDIGNESTLRRILGMHRLFRRLEKTPARLKTQSSRDDFNEDWFSPTAVK